MEYYYWFIVLEIDCRKKLNLFFRGIKFLVFYIVYIVWNGEKMILVRDWEISYVF